MKNAKTAFAGLLAFFILLFLTPLAVSAAGDIPTMDTVVQGTGIPMVNLTVFLLGILRVFFGLLGVIAVALLIYGGFIWMTASGEPDKVNKAKQIIYNTIIGLIVIFSAFAISSFLMSWLSGWGGGGGGGGEINIPGGNGDWSRSAIGAGPIQSVYPAPNAVNIPINTRIAVTFKVDIKPDSICNPAETGDTDTCDGDTMKNVSICEIGPADSDCLADSTFNSSAYEGSTVYQASPTNKKTFVFYPGNNLGNDDAVNRTFKVVLAGGITAVATNQSVFDGLRVNYYNWAFKTNGVLDLTPPEVANLELYPNPDNVADSWGATINLAGSSATNNGAADKEFVKDDTAGTLVSGWGFNTGQEDITYNFNVTTPGEYNLIIGTSNNNSLGPLANPPLDFNRYGSCGLGGYGSGFALYHNLRVIVDNVEIGTINALAGNPDSHQSSALAEPINLTAGAHTIKIRFLNDCACFNDCSSGQVDSNLKIYGLSLINNASGASQSTTGSASITATTMPKLETPATLNGAPFLGIPLTGISAIFATTPDPGIPHDFLKLSISGFSVPIPITLTFIVDSDTQGRYITFLPTPPLVPNGPLVIDTLGINFSTTGNCVGKSLDDHCLSVVDNQVVMTGLGITITPTGNFSTAAGTTWGIALTPAIAGDEVTLMNGDNATRFLFAVSSLPDQITKTTIGPNGQSINTAYYTVKSSGTTAAVYMQGLANILTAQAGSFLSASIDSADNRKINVTARNAGSNNLALTENSSALSVSGSLSGAQRVSAVTPLPAGSKGDPYNNSVFRVSFTEAVNPVAIGDFIEVKVNNTVVDATVALINQYRTVELTGTHECGINSCGKTIYCWLDPNAAEGSVLASVEIIAAGLKHCASGNQDSAGNEWCRGFGGTCQAGSDNGRCKLASGFYYPQAASTVDGIIDMANNSFNGNFDKQANGRGVLTGNAQGQSGTAAGQSGQPSYNANSHLDDNGLRFSFANDDDANGDNFSWSFFISTQIDKAAPLLSKILPIGDYSLGGQVGESFRDPVKLVFNGLMRLATLKPGWGYGAGPTDPKWNTRHVTLKTITSGANPVGYWVSSANLDEGDIATGQGQGDGLADYTIVNINHNPFDQAISYGPLSGNGVESITQNCFLPAGGPIDANAAAPEGKCVYNADGTTSGCVTDASISADSRVVPTNPSSYGYMNCRDIDGAVLCASGKICKVHNAASSGASIPNGSWIITKDKSIVTDTNTGETGCCFGKCF